MLTPTLGKLCCLSFPSLVSTNPSEATLFGSLIGNLVSIDKFLEGKIHSLKTMGDRLQLLQAHDALCLLRHAFAIPKLLYGLRTAPCFQSPVLNTFDATLCQLLESICYIHLDDYSWLQASLPANSGVLGIRSAVLLALSTYLASAAGSTPITMTILPPKFEPTLPSIKNAVLTKWKLLTGDSSDLPSGTSASLQKSWDSPVVSWSFSKILDNFTGDPRATACLLPVQQKEACAWVTAPPMSSLGLRMANETICIAVGLRLGISLCSPHTCHLCGESIDSSGLHGLSCRRSQGRLPRHNHLNMLVKHSLASANIPSVLEPQGLCRADNRRPDGLTISPWSKGRPLVWDVTVWDTFAPTYLPISSAAAGSVGECAATRKRSIYSTLSSSHIVLPVAFETSGVFGSDALQFVREIATRSRYVTKNPLAYLKLCQQISVCIQNFNSACIMGCCPP